MADMGSFDNFDLTTNIDSII